MECSTMDVRWLRLARSFAVSCTAACVIGTPAIAKTYCSAELGTFAGAKDVIFQLEPAARAGNRYEAYRLGSLLTSSFLDEPTPEHRAKGLHWLTRLARLGSWAAQLQLAEYYDRVAKSPAQASLAYLEAARRGSTQAALAIGFAYLRGEGVPVQLDKARFWLEAAARDGHVTAHHGLAQFYSKRATSSDDRSWELYHRRRAAEGGFVVAQVEYSDDLLRSGQVEDALLWASRAAEDPASGEYWKSQAEQLLSRIGQYVQAERIEAARTAAAVYAKGRYTRMSAALGRLEHKSDPVLGCIPGGR
jgi:TPR repeat protein